MIDLMIHIISRQFIFYSYLLMNLTEFAQLLNLDQPTEIKAA